MKRAQLAVTLTSGLIALIAGCGDTTDADAGSSAAPSPTNAPGPYSGAQVTEACDRVINADWPPGLAVPPIAYCVGHGDDSDHIDGLSIAVEPRDYAKLSAPEKDTAEGAFAAAAHMPVFLKVGSGPSPA